MENVPYFSKNYLSSDNKFHSMLPEKKSLDELKTS